jgi:hypothetical protein
MRVPGDNLLPVSGSQPSETSWVMAIATQRQLDDLPEPGFSGRLKEGIELQREKEETSGARKPAREINPGERIEDPQRGPSPSGRDVRVS